MTKLSMVMIDLEPNWSWSKQKQAQETLLRLGVLVGIVQEIKTFTQNLFV